MWPYAWWQCHRLAITIILHKSMDAWFLLSLDSVDYFLVKIIHIDKRKNKKLCSKHPFFMFRGSKIQFGTTFKSLLLEKMLVGLYLIIIWPHNGWQLYMKWNKVLIFLTMILWIVDGRWPLIFGLQPFSVSLVWYH